MTAERTYEDIAAAYATHLRTLFAPPKAGVAAEQATEQLPARAERLADLAEQFGSLTAVLLDTPDRAQQLAAEERLLSHAAASAEAARQLLEAANQGGGPGAQGVAAASVGVSLHELARLIESPAGPASPAAAPSAPTAPTSPSSPTTTPTPTAPTTPTSQPTPPPASPPGPTPPAPASPTGPTPAPRPAPPPVPADPKLVKATLNDQATKTLQAITDRTCKVMDDGLRDLLLLDAATLYQGVSLVSKDAAQLLQQAASALGALAQKLVTCAIRLLLESFNAILALLGGNNQQSRSQVTKWVDQLKVGGQSQPGIEAVKKLVMHIYEPDAVKEDVAGWLETTQAAPAEIAQTAEAVQGLSQHYDATANRVEQLLKVIVFLKALPLANTPQGTVVVAAVMLGVVGYTVYTGYTHVDSGRIVFANRFGFDIPERIAGVRQTVQSALAAEEASPTPTA
jgi:hypothetical protein